MRSIIRALEHVGLNYWSSCVKVPIADCEVCLHRKICQCCSMFAEKNVEVSWLNMVESKRVVLMNVQLQRLYQDCAVDSKLEADQLHSFYPIFFRTFFSHQSLRL